MKRVFIFLLIASFVLAFSTPGVPSERTSNEPPPVAQALVREGDFAVELAQELRLGALDDEAQAESALSAIGVAPRNGWIADYPVTPVVLAEIQFSIREAARRGDLSLSEDEAIQRLVRVAASFGLPIRTGDGAYAENPSGEASQYVAESTVDDYYAAEGPPVVSYYRPPEDYYYLYDWVPYPFFYSSFAFPGFFILHDFHVVSHHHHQRFFHHHKNKHFFNLHKHRDFFDHHKRKHFIDHKQNKHAFKHVSNRFFDKNGRAFRINPGDMSNQRITNRITNVNVKKNFNNNPGRGFAPSNVQSARSILRKETSGRSFPVSPGGRTGITSGPGRAFGLNQNRDTSGAADRPFPGGGMKADRSFNGMRRSDGVPGGNQSIGKPAFGSAPPGGSQRLGSPRPFRGEMGGGPGGPGRSFNGASTFKGNSAFNGGRTFRGGGSSGGGGLGARFGNVNPGGGFGKTGGGFSGGGAGARFGSGPGFGGGGRSLGAGSRSFGGGPGARFGGGPGFGGGGRSFGGGGGRSFVGGGGRSFGGGGRSFGSGGGGRGGGGRGGGRR